MHRKIVLFQGMTLLNFLSNVKRHH